MNKKESPKRRSRPPRRRGKTASAASGGEGISLLEPMIREPVFASFGDLARAYDALIHEFYNYYRQSSQDEPTLFGFVTVRHRVKFLKDVDSIFTENVIGQKTTLICAPWIEGESTEDQERRRLQLLAAFDHTKRASHILALALLAGLLRGPGLRKLIERQAARGVR